MNDYREILTAGITIAKTQGREGAKTNSNLIHLTDLPQPNPTEPDPLAKPVLDREPLPVGFRFESQRG